MLGLLLGLIGDEPEHSRGERHDAEHHGRRGRKLLAAPATPVRPCDEVPNVGAQLVAPAALQIERIRQIGVTQKQLFLGRGRRLVPPRDIAARPANGFPGRAGPR